MCVHHRRDRLGLTLRFQGRIQLCLVASKVSSVRTSVSVLGPWLFASVQRGLLCILFKSDWLLFLSPDS